jgi:hypothetical protein
MERPCLQLLVCYVGFEVFTVVVLKSIIFWDMTPCSPLSFNRCFGGTYRLHLQGRRNRFPLLARWFAEPISLTLKMEAISSSDTSVETQRTTRRHIPEDDTLCLYAVAISSVYATFQWKSVRGLTMTRMSSYPLPTVQRCSPRNISVEAVWHAVPG